MPRRDAGHSSGRWCTDPGPERPRRPSCGRYRRRSRGSRHTPRMNSRVHPKYKTKYRVTNWPEYDRGLVQRGDVTVWLSADAIAAWKPTATGRRGGQLKYSDIAIETALTLRLVFHLVLSQRCADALTAPSGPISCRHADRLPAAPRTHPVRRRMGPSGAAADDRVVEARATFASGAPSAPTSGRVRSRTRARRAPLTSSST